MNSFYISHVGDSVTELGITRPKAIGITAKTHSGTEWPLRLIPGYDPYMSFLIVRNGLLDIYRFDRRMGAMTDRSELQGLDHDALKEIAAELCRNLFSKESGVTFLKQIVGEFRFPDLVLSPQGTGVYAGSFLIFTLTNSKGYYRGYDVGLGKMPQMEMSILGVKITHVAPTLVTEFSKRVRAKYGKRTHVTFSGCITKK